MNNYWKNVKTKKQIISKVNGMLSKFIGRKAQPLKDLFDSMQRNVIKYFKNNPDDLDTIMKQDKNFKYSFEIEEKNGLVTRVELKYD